ncbi:MAG: VWA domain-containing protein [Anaerolineales bacterium]
MKKHKRKQFNALFAFFKREFSIITDGRPRERGQALVITAVAFMAMLAFAGLVTDAGTLYLNFTRLKRGLDSAAVAAANQIRDSSLPAAQRAALIRESAREMLMLNSIDDIYSLETYICDDAGIPAAFASVCPASGEDGRKLAWIQATQNSPVYFLGLFGVDTIPITTHSIGEAASIDVVLVIDTSESMASSTAGYNANFDPSACNAANSCQPLRDAKDAAKAMVDKLFDGYDRIAVVTYDFSATVHDPDLATSDVLESDHAAVKGAIDAIQLHDDTDLDDIIATGKNPLNGELNPLDINGDGTYTGGVPSGFGDAIVSTCTCAASGWPEISSKPRVGLTVSGSSFCFRMERPMSATFRMPRMSITRFPLATSTLPGTVVPTMEMLQSALPERPGWEITRLPMMWKTMPAISQIG